MGLDLGVELLLWRLWREIRLCIGYGLGWGLVPEYRRWLGLRLTRR